jgi:apolipoprotein D and lipocalin family protein
LDKEHYQWAMVCGADRDNLWILARSPNLNKVVLEKLIKQAKDLGFATGELIFDQHGI